MRSALVGLYRSMIPERVRNWIDFNFRMDEQTKRAVEAGGERTRYIRRVRYELFLSIGFFANVNRPIHGAYMEFGCYKANTMRLAWKAFRPFGWSFIAFDSFEGLPEIAEIDKQPIWEQGKLAMGESDFRKVATSTGMPDARLRTVKGFYSDSLTPELAATIKEKAAVIYIDCDLYTSTVDVLRWIPPFLQPGTFVIFDDWDAFMSNPNKGERRAWREFLEANPTLRFEEFGHEAMAKSFVYVGNPLDQSVAPS